MYDLFDRWCRQNKISHFENTSGVKNFEKLVEDLGYQGNSNFRYGSSIELFLADNPGAIDALIQFICSFGQEGDEWHENLLGVVGEEDDEEESEED